MVFSTPYPAPGETVILHDSARGCHVTLARGWLPAPTAQALCARLLADTPWVAEAPVMFGRPMPVRRRSHAYGAPGTRYRYTGMVRVADPWPPDLAAVATALSQRLGTPLDFVLCNLYPDGAAGLGWHADDEADLRPDAPIASVSLGAPRDFHLRLGRTGTACVKVSLDHGSLLVMHGATQRYYQHRVPPRARCTEPRINLTFRAMR